MSLQVDITKNFGSFTLDAQFTAEDGVMALLGNSGCGKSMTLKCIAGVIRPDRGRIIADGVTLFDADRHIDLNPQQRRIGLLFQNYALFPNMTVEQNILCGLRRDGDKRGRAVKLRQFMETFYLSGLEKRYPHQLSGGQQQRVALTRILAGEPRVLMLDEPFAALDSYLKWQLEQELIDVLSKFSGTTLYVSHDRDEVYRLCGKVCVMDNGRTQQVQSVKQLFAAPQTMSAALLCGCKNFSRVEYIDRHHLRAVDWGCILACTAPTNPDIRYIGIRAHHLTEGQSEQGNTIDCRILRNIDDVAAHVSVLQPLDLPQPSKYSRLIRETPIAGEDYSGDSSCCRIYINPDKIMLLK